VRYHEQLDVIAGNNSHRRTSDHLVILSRKVEKKGKGNEKRIGRYNPDDL